MTERLEHRIETLERAITDGDHDLSALAAEADAVDRLETLESRVDEIDDRVSELEAATQALRGYVGNIRSVNTDVEQRAETAIAKVESLESALDIDEGVVTGTPAPPGEATAAPEATNGGAGNESNGQHPDACADESAASGVEECTACGRPRSAGSPRDQGLTDGGRHRSADANDTSDASNSTNTTRVYRTAQEGGGEDGGGKDVFPDAPDPISGEDGQAGTLQRIRNML